MFVAFLFLAIIVIFVCLFFIIDRIITLKRLEINQKEWDEYSAGKSLKWKLDNFVDFSIENKYKHGWPYYYFPRM
jgi:hypothetical protein